MTDTTTNNIDAAPGMPEAFHVHDAATANWVVRKIIEARQYAKRVEEWAAAERRRAEREERFFMFRFGAQLEQWARAQIEAGSNRRKSICLPAGRIGLRTPPPRLGIVDEVRLLSWCRANLPAAVIVTERVSRQALHDHVKATGECPDGTEVPSAIDVLFIR